MTQVQGEVRWIGAEQSRIANSMKTRLEQWSFTRKGSLQRNAKNKTEKGSTKCWCNTKQKVLCQASCKPSGSVSRPSKCVPKSDQDFDKGENFRILKVCSTKSHLEEIEKSWLVSLTSPQVCFVCGPNRWKEIDIYLQWTGQRQNQPQIWNSSWSNLQKKQQWCRGFKWEWENICVDVVGGVVSPFDRTSQRNTF